MSYGNGSVGQCACGRLALASCRRCGTALCDTHAAEMPATPTGVSADAIGQWILVVRTTDGVHCAACRADIGDYVLEQARSAPKASLPDHWLDRAIALSSDHSRSDEEKIADAGLPPSLTANDVAREFLRRIEKQPCEQVPVGPLKRLQIPDYVAGWTVDCRRTEYASVGGGVRYPLPCLISVDGELLGPMLEEGARGEAWWVVPETDIELQRLVTAVAQILVLSAFIKDAPSVG